MKFIRPAALLLMLGSASGLAAAADPSLTSFADLYRLTVSGAQAAPAAATLAAAPAELDGRAEAALRPVSTEAPPARTAFTVAAPPQLAGYAFSIGAVPQPQRWLLLLSGLAAAAWVARRRLYSF
ncbi:MAG TPA: hypothetical protein VNH80_09070 [Burkholderiales bacterium]|nr:hypothetical protein [Burkholderiales bacterium]